MIKQHKQSHFFHAFGYGFGAHIRKPFCETLHSQAATCVGAHGGHAFATASNINLREVIRIGEARTQIAAIEEHDSYDTVVTASVENINILNHVTADRIVAHLAVKDDKDLRKRADGTLEPSTMWFQTIGTSFENLRIGGVSVEVEIEDEAGRNYHGPTPSSHNPVYDPFDPGKGPVNKEINPKAHRTTLVKNVSSTSRNAGRIKPLGNMIIIPDFGVIHLAEYLVTPNARHLNMLRIEFGCGVDGWSTGPGSSSNGETIKP